MVDGYITKNIFSLLLLLLPFIIVYKMQTKTYIIAYYHDYGGIVFFIVLSDNIDRRVPGWLAIVTGTTTGEPVYLFQ